MGCLIRTSQRGVVIPPAGFSTRYNNSSGGFSTKIVSQGFGSSLQAFEQRRCTNASGLVCCAGHVPRSAQKAGRACTLQLANVDKGFQRKFKKSVTPRSKPTKAAANAEVITEQQNSEGSLEIEEDAKIQELRGWLGELGWDDYGLAVVGEGVGAYAAVAKEEFEEDDILVEVPEAAFMTEQTALKCPLLGPLIAEHGLNSWQALCAHLLCERARARSFWAPYINSLPSETDMQWAHPLLWPAEERCEWLEGSPTLTTLETRLEQCRSDYEALEEAGVGEAFMAEFGRSILSEESVRWAAAVLLSRSFSLDLGGDEPTLALVPWADLLNHSSAATAVSCLVLDHDTRTAVLGAHTDYQPGQEVYDSYGPGLPPGQLFLDYGFVDWENAADVIDLPASVLGKVVGKANRALLKAVGLPAESTLFSLSQSGADETLLAWTRVSVADSKELSDAGWSSASASVQSAGSVMARFAEPVNKRNELQALLLLIRACDAQLKKYPERAPSSEESHEAESNNLQQNARAAARRSAEQLIVSEQKAVNGARKWLLKRLREAKGTPEGQV